METPDVEAQLEAAEQLGLYPIRVVAAQTGLGVHTLRAWERRYGLPRPTRTAGEHRLYRMEDIMLLRRVQALIARGTPPSRACAIVLAESDAESATPEASLGPAVEPAVGKHASIAVLSLRSQLRTASVALDEESAMDALNQAFALFGPELALEQVILPTLAEIGTAWAEGRASVATEHFASMLVRARLLSAFESASRNDRQPVALLAAAPDDQHELPTLALALLLRKRGWHAIFLGPNTPVEALRDAIVRTRPRLIVLSAATTAIVPGLVAVFAELRQMPECATAVLGYGGAPFRDDPALRRLLDGSAMYLGDDVRQAANRAHLILLSDSMQSSGSA